MYDSDFDLEEVNEPQGPNPYKASTRLPGSFLCGIKHYDHQALTSSARSLNSGHANDGSGYGGLM